MASWKEINEVGGTVVLRIIAGAFALLFLVALLMALLNGHFSLEKLATCGAGMALMGGYALFGNRLRGGGG